MNAPAEFTPGFWSLWDMLELNANSFLAAATHRLSKSRKYIEQNRDGHLVALGAWAVSGVEINELLQKQIVERSDP